MYSADKAAYIAMTSIKWGGMLVDEDQISVQPIEDSDEFYDYRIKTSNNALHGYFTMKYSYSGPNGLSYGKA